MSSKRCIRRQARWERAGWMLAWAGGLQQGQRPEPAAAGASCASSRPARAAAGADAAAVSPAPPNILRRRSSVIFCCSTAAAVSSAAGSLPYLGGARGEGGGEVVQQACVGACQLCALETGKGPISDGS